MQNHETPRTKREVTLTVVILISVVVDALVGSMIQVQMKTYNDILNGKFKDLKNRSKLQLHQVKDQVTELQTQQL